MKTVFTLIVVAFQLSTSIAQEKNIETQAVTIENFITFIVENYSLKQATNSSVSQNITFVVQVPENDLFIEDKIILKQAFKLLSKRLFEEDNISIITYSGFNGVALKQVSPTNLKKVLFTINNLKSSVKKFHNDGIDLAFNYAKDNFDEKTKNTVVLIRNPNVSSSINTQTVAATNKSAKKRSGAVLITALSLLPELIAVIKN